MKPFMMLVLSLFALVGLVALLPGGQTTVTQLIAQAMPPNTNPPAYLKDVVAYKEGNGLVIYVTLADRHGAFTSADGTLYVTIRHEGLTVWTQVYSVDHTQFRTEQVGLGTFARTVLLCGIGRIDAKMFHLGRRGLSLTVDVEFFVNGQRLTGSQNVWL
jgi:hypothetical protein